MFDPKNILLLINYLVILWSQSKIIDYLEKKNQLKNFIFMSIITGYNGLQFEQKLIRNFDQKHKNMRLHFKKLLVA